MDIDLDALSMAAYAGTIIAALLAEFCPWCRIASACQRAEALAAR